MTIPDLKAALLLESITGSCSATEWEAMMADIRRLTGTGHYEIVANSPSYNQRINIHQYALILLEYLHEHYPEG